VAERDGDDPALCGAAPEAAAQPGNAVLPVSTPREPDGATWLAELGFAAGNKSRSQLAEHGMWELAPSPG
jgi:hypothetical protein